MQDAGFCKDEMRVILACRAPVLEYQCPREDCQAVFSTLRANELIDFSDGLFHCQVCRSVLDARLGDGIVGDDNLRRKRNREAKQLQVKSTCSLHITVHCAFLRALLPPPPPPLQGT